jgi:hypothetical protein
MSQAPLLRIYLAGNMLHTSRAGTFNFMNVLRAAVEGAGWRIEFHETGPDARRRAPDLDGYALFHLEPPTHDGALTFRRAYHYPFWQIAPVPQRWRFHSALSPFEAQKIEPEPAHRFADNLRNRVIPGPEPRRGDRVLVPLQGHIRQCRSFQTMSPVEMLATTAAATPRPVIATLHPNEVYDDKDMQALNDLAARHANLTIGGDTTTILRDCAFVVAQNSAVAFDGYLLGKPAVLFAQIDFHHIALNVADLGAEQALALAETHAPDFDRYLYWFLQEQCINASRPDAGHQILTQMRRGGWPI